MTGVGTLSSLPMKFALKDFFLLLTFPAIMSVGQIMFREAAIKFSGKPITEMLLGLLRTPIFHAAIVFYIVATVVWVWLLSRYPLAVAYPIAVLAVIFTPAIDALFFNRHLTSVYWLGLGLIIAGVIVVVRPSG
jgi:drug/metabolite transporter (DMT)-like permease